jgi:hypothetical protein
MSSPQPVSERVLDQIPRVEDAVSVGEDLDFQRRWWRFEKAAWVLLALVLVADALGAFGRGWLARGERHSADGTLRLRYERIERTGTPSNLIIDFGASAVHDQKVRLFSSESIVKELGAQRIIPEPTLSDIGPGGITYTFPMTGSPATASIALQPSFPGIHHFELRVPGADPIRTTIVVLP